MNIGPIIIDTKDIPDKDWKDFYKHISDYHMMPIMTATSTSTSIQPIATSRDVAYINLMVKINILLTAKVIEPREAARLVSMLDSADEENWTVAVECIKQKLSEL